MAKNRQNQATSMPNGATIPAREKAIHTSANAAAADPSPSISIDPEIPL
jgi:hypothetical protein